MILLWNTNPATKTTKVCGQMLWMPLARGYFRKQHLHKYPTNLHHIYKHTPCQVLSLEVCYTKCMSTKTKPTGMPWNWPIGPKCTKCTEVTRMRKCWKKGYIQPVLILGVWSFNLWVVEIYIYEWCTTHFF